LISFLKDFRFHEKITVKEKVGATQSKNNFK